MRRRLDVELVRRGLCATRSEALLAIRAGSVLIGGRPASKAATLVAPEEAVTLAASARPFVSRGGEKLAGALDRLGVRLEGARALDAGASTGGFTDCLLTRGAAAVIAVDVGYGQLDWRLHEDPRVTVLERTNARHLEPGDLPFAPDLVVADLSFISLRTVVPALARVADAGARFVLLVKPQFEAGRGDVGSGGVVRDPDAWRRAVAGVAEACGACGLPPTGVVASPLLGPAGNAEFFVAAGRGGSAASAADFEAALDAAVAEAGRLVASRAGRVSA